MLGCLLPVQAGTLFRAELRPEYVVPIDDGLSPAGLSIASGVGNFDLSLTPGAPLMTYEITFKNLDLEDITGVHFHFGHAPLLTSYVALLKYEEKEWGPLHHDEADGPNGPHLLNIFGAPREDDANLVVDYENNRISGRWDNLDLNFGPDGVRDAGDSVAIGSVIGEILAEEVYVQVHTNAFPAPNTGEIRGQLLAIPEPGNVLLLSLGTMIFTIFRKRR